MMVERVSQHHEEGRCALDFEFRPINGHGPARRIRVESEEPMLVLDMSAGEPYDVAAIAPREGG